MCWYLPPSDLRYGFPWWWRFLGGGHGWDLKSFCGSKGFRLLYSSIWGSSLDEGWRGWLYRQSRSSIPMEVGPTKSGLKGSKWSSTSFGGEGVLKLAWSMSPDVRSCKWFSIPVLQCTWVAGHYSQGNGGCCAIVSFSNALLDIAWCSALVMGSWCSVGGVYPAAWIGTREWDCWGRQRLCPRILIWSLIIG